jgi:hypothetical protein
MVSVLDLFLQGGDHIGHSVMSATPQAPSVAPSLTFAMRVSWLDRAKRGGCSTGALQRCVLGPWRAILDAGLWGFRKHRGYRTQFVDGGWDRIDGADGPT